MGIPSAALIEVGCEVQADVVNSLHLHVLLIVFVPQSLIVLFIFVCWAEFALLTIVAVNASAAHQTILQ